MELKEFFDKYCRVEGQSPGVVPFQIREIEAHIKIMDAGHKVRLKIAGRNGPFWYCELCGTFTRDPKIFDKCTK